MRQLTKDEKRTATELIRARLVYINYGMLRNSEPNISLRDHMAFNEQGWEIDKNMSYILKDGAPAYKIKRKWNRGREQQPSLEYLGA